MHKQVAGNYPTTCFYYKIEKKVFATMIYFSTQ